MTYPIAWTGQIHRDLEPGIRKELRELFFGPDDDDGIDPDVAGIVFHHYQLTDDMSGPTVFITGCVETGGVTCTYLDKVDWRDGAAE